MYYRLLISAVMLAGLSACSDASSGAPTEGTFSSTVDGARFSGSPMVYFPRNIALIQNGKSILDRYVQLSLRQCVHSETKNAPSSENAGDASRSV